MRNQVRQVRQIVKPFTFVLASILFFCFSSSLVFANDSSSVYYEMFVERECLPDQRTRLILPAVARLIVPKGAVDAPTDVGMEISFYLHTDDPEVTILFSPPGKTFNIPVRLRMSLLMMQFYYGDEIAVNYYNEATGLWEVVDTFTLTWQNSNYEIEFEHFSLYAFTTLRNGS
ncbi:hypothetical protein K8T06_06510 [bacterium]|nr:hypothetical protein [bacterium]